MISAVEVLRQKTANAMMAQSASQGSDPRYPRSRTFPGQITTNEPVAGRSTAPGAGAVPGGVNSGFQPLTDFAAK